MAFRFEGMKVISNSSPFFSFQDISMRSLIYTFNSSFSTSYTHDPRSNVGVANLVQQFIEQIEHLEDTNCVKDIYELSFAFEGET